MMPQRVINDLASDPTLPYGIFDCTPRALRDQNTSGVHSITENTQHGMRVKKMAVYRITDPVTVAAFQACGWEVHRGTASWVRGDDKKAS